MVCHRLQQKYRNRLPSRLPRLLLILPLCVTTMNVIILRTYIANSIPGELMEAATIDGAGDYRTFFQITLPR